MSFGFLSAWQEARDCLSWTVAISRTETGGGNPRDNPRLILGIAFWAGQGGEALQRGQC